MSKTPVYYQPHNMEELKGLLPDLPDHTAVLAGGTDLMIKIRDKHPDIDAILSLWCMDELKTITERDGYVCIGAMVTHTQAEEDPLILKYFRALHQSCSHVGSKQIRNKGTLGGSLMNASPAGDILPCLLLFGGLLEFTGRDGTKTCKADELYGSDGKPAVKPGEILTQILLPVQPGLESSFVKLGSRKEVTISQISLCCSYCLEGSRILPKNAYAGAIDRKPWAFLHPELFGDPQTADKAADELREKIRDVRLHRSRPPKLKITEDQRLYKERAAKGIVWDLMTDMGVLKEEEACLF